MAQPASRYRVSSEKVPDSVIGKVTGIDASLIENSPHRFEEN
jgi:hypothetical protein